jgi:hypothetical protein
MRQRPPFSNILVEAMRQGAEQTPRSTNSLDVMLPCYLTSATSTSPTITSGIPRANSTTLCLIPAPTDAHPWTQSRSPMDMMVQGWSMSLFQASQQ